MCCDSWGRKELDTTERLNGTECLYNIEVCGIFILLTNVRVLFVLVLFGFVLYFYQVGQFYHI